MAKNNNARVHQISRRGRPKLTIQEKLLATLDRNDGFVALKTIYKSLKARTIGEQAGIRGVLNRGCEGGLFKRNRKTQGEYTLAA